MKRILLTGGGTGGHIYPLIAVGNTLQKVGRDDVRVEYIGPKSHLTKEIKKNNIRVYKITGAKIRRYFDLKNFIDIPKFIYSILEAFVKIYFIMPDVVFSKGGPGSVPVVLAAKFYMIPIVVHESDSVPSLTTKITSKLAKKVAVSFERTLDYFPKKKVFLSGNPLRKEFLSEGHMNKTQAKSYLGFDHGEPLVLVMGGSQGAVRINETIVNYLEDFIENFQILHLVGSNNLHNTENTVKVLYKQWDQEKKKRYSYQAFLEVQEMVVAMKAADLIISRSGAGTIFESALLELPAILVPLEESANNHQKVNAHEYAKTGSAIVIEESNLSPNIIISRAKKILQSQQDLQKMKTAAKEFSKPEAAQTITKEIFNLL